MYQDIQIDIGSSSTSTENWVPYKTYYYKNKVQFLIMADELESYGIGSGTRISALSCRVSQKPTSNVRNFRIRLKETLDSSLSAWHTTGLTLVYFKDSIAHNDFVNGNWYEHEFNEVEEYAYQGGNLLIEISRDDTTGSNAGGMYIRTGLSNGRMLTAYADSGYSFPFDNFPIKNTLNQIIDITLSVYIPKYKSSGTSVSDLIQLNKKSKIYGIYDKPEGTDIKIETSTDGVNWTEKSFEDTISAGNVYFKVTLSTEDENKTPILKELWLEEPQQREDTILLTMNPLKRFCNVEGRLTVKYDATKGNLTGTGGAVESFEVDFTPEDLVQEPNPHVAEYLTAELTGSIDFIEIEKVEVEGAEEYLTAELEGSIKLWHVDDAPL